jgi:benzoate-CoA ligase
VTTPYNACVDLLDGNVERGRGDHPAVVSRARTVTYSELLAEVQRVAASLRALGVQPEQRVAMVMLDSVEFFATFLGAMRIGAVPAPVNPLLPGRDLGAVVSVGRARVLVVSSERTGELDAVRAAAPEIADVVTTDPDGWDSFLARGVGAGGEAFATWEESPGFWLCTSGSTGRPKLAMHRHVDLRRTADTYASSVLAIRPDDRCYSVGPMFHAYGLGNSLTFPFSVGATAIVEPTRPPNPTLVGGIAPARHHAVRFQALEQRRQRCRIQPQRFANLADGAWRMLPQRQHGKILRIGQAERLEQRPV